MRAADPTPEIFSDLAGEAEVLVVGGGPAGAVAAALLAESGRRVLLVESGLQSAAKVCGEFVGAEAWPVLGRVTSRRRLEGAGALPIRSVQIRSAGGGRVDAPLTRCAGETGFALSRVALDSLLRSEAEKRGARLQFGARLVGLSAPTAGGRRAALRIAGRTHPVRAKLVIGADGRNSTVARLAGLAVRWAQPRLGIQIHLLRRCAPPDRVELLLWPGAYAGLVPIEEERWCLGALLRLPATPGRDPREVLLARFRRDPTLAEAGEVLSWQATFPVRTGRRRCHAPGVLLAGDAAGTVDPFCGQGIALALVTGAAAAETGSALLAAGGDDEARRRRYAALVRRQIGSRFLAGASLRPLVDRPYWASPLLERLNARPGAAERLVALTRASRRPPLSVLSEILGRLARS